MEKIGEEKRKESTIIDEKKNLLKPKGLSRFFLLDNAVLYQRIAFNCSAISACTFFAS